METIYEKILDIWSDYFFAPGCSLAVGNDGKVTIKLLLKTFVYDTIEDAADVCLEDIRSLLEDIQDKHYEIQYSRIHAK